MIGPVAYSRADRRAFGTRYVALARALLAIALCAAGLSAPVRAATPAYAAASDAVQTALQDRIARISDPVLASIYGAAGNMPIWLDPAAPQRRQRLLSLLQHRAGYGLPPDPDCMAFPEPDSTSAQTVASAELRLTACLLRLRSDVARGVATDADLGPDWALRSDVPAFTTADVADVLNGNAEGIVSRAEPPFPAYQALRHALQSYLDQQAHNAWPVIDVSSEIAIDGSDGRLTEVLRRLRADGYLPGDDIAPAVLASAIRQYQARNGLEADGRLGKRTLAALNEPLQERITQISVNLERWRHVPRSREASYVAVNVADATLEVIQDNRRVAEMRAIIGAPAHPTPVFHASIAAVTFNPAWTIPLSIASREILPKVKRNHGYLQDNNIRILNRPDDPFGMAVDWQHVARSHFPFELRQDPGSKNPLGLIKFEMTNPFDVYIHDTPAKSLFALPRRGLSHGCIRVQDPETLATLLLPDRTAADIRATISRGITTTIPLRQRLPVDVLYWTAFVDSDGALNFRDDIYGRDQALANALHLGRGPQLIGANLPGQNETCS